MPLKNFLKKNLISCAPEDTIKEVACLMRDENVGAIVVTKEDKPLGIVTDRDLVIRCVADGEDCSETPIEEVMTKGVETATVEDGIFDVIQVMRKNEIRRVPIVDEKGKAVGLLSFGDIYQLIGQEMSDLLAPTAPEEPKLKQTA